MSGVRGYKKPILSYVSNDVALVKQEAAFVISFTGRSIPVFRENPEGRLNVTAVIGPGVGLPGTPVAGSYFQEALLCEIGLSRTRPYRPTNRFNRRRRKWFSMTPEQYQEAGALIFLILQWCANKRIGGWKNRFFFLPTPHLRWRKRIKSLTEYQRYQEQERGARFSVSVGDQFLLSDVYAVQLQNPQLVKQMSGLANVIDLRLNKHRRGYRWDFEKLRAASDVRRIFRSSSLPNYLKVQMLEYLPDKKKNAFFYRLAEMLQWDLEDPPQIALAKSALPTLHERTDGIRLKVVRERPEYVVIEIFSDKPFQGATQNAS